MIIDSSSSGDVPSEVVSLQPVSVVDHVCKVDPDTLKLLINDEIGGSRRVEIETIRELLAAVGEYFSKAGGSASNTMRGLAGFGVKTKIVGARGIDEWGAMFNSSMKRAGVDVERVVPKEGTTGRCCILSCEGQRTMRTCLDGAARLQPEELSPSDFSGTKFVYLSGYCLYTEGLLEAAIKLAQAAGCKVALDLGSFEIVRSFRTQLNNILESGAVTLCFCNEDEAIEIAGGAPGTIPEDGLRYLSSYCDISVVTLGAQGCIVKERGVEDNGVIAQPACGGVTVVDTTGAGDLFAAGFLYSILRGYSLQRAAEIGCLAGGAVVQTLGAEMGPTQWHWLHQRLHGELAAETVRSSAAAVQQELLECYALIERKGRGVVYYGSARLREGNPHWEQAKKLSSLVAAFLGSCTWSGGGPGIMEATIKGALEAGFPVGGIRIAREAGNTVLSASYLPAESFVLCRFLSSRKVALVDSGVRMKEEDRTAFIFLPGGLGTMDEFFEILTLVQLRKMGTKYPVPLILCNFSGFYNGLLEFLGSCNELGTVGSAELNDLLVADDIEAVIDALSQFYNIQRKGEDGAKVDGVGRSKVLRASEFLEKRAKERNVQ